AGGSPPAVRWIIEFGACESVGVLSSSDEYLAIWQERGCRFVSRTCHAARRGPQPGPRIIEFRARENVVAVFSSSDEYLAIWQERGCKAESRTCHAARRGPQPGPRIIEFRARENAVDAPFSSSSDKHRAVWQQRCNMVVSWTIHAARRGPHARCLRWSLRSDYSSHSLTQPGRSRKEADRVKGRTEQNARN